MSKSFTLSGKTTCRGVGVTRTVRCSFQASHNKLFAGGTFALEIPNPFPRSRPGHLLKHRHGIVVKYFDIGTPAGTFFLIERNAPGLQAKDTGYPVKKVPSPETLKQKRLKQIFLPMTGLIRLYSGGASIEFGSTLEFG